MDTHYTVEQIISQVPKPFLYVDYNERVAGNAILLSQADMKNDYHGNPIALYEGLEVVGYQEDEDMEGVRDDIIMEGICIPNRLGDFQHVKWLLKANDKGIRYMSDIMTQGW